jgi:NAD(P)-dependent dehydrogenase (short-subunit alcohol dehydrogenase family)
MSISLAGRSALITGASQGLGLAIARAFVRAGANVFLCARDRGALEEVRTQLQAEASPGRSVLAIPADVSVEADVAAVVRAALEAFPDLQVLVNNAGVYGPLGAIEDTNWIEWVKAIEINLLGSVLVCRALVPHFKRRGGGKIIQISGGGATNPLPNMSAYATSKAAVVRFSETLAEELRSYHVDVNAVAPGMLNTRLLDQVLAAGPDRVGAPFYERARDQKAQGGVPLEKGADLCVYLASTVSDGITGKLISAVWDPWETFQQNRADLDRSDIYALRRIVPKDRGKAWGDR